MVKGLIAAGKRFGDIIKFMNMDEDQKSTSMISSRRRKSRSSRSGSRDQVKQSKQSWIQPDESTPQLSGVVSGNTDLKQSEFVISNDNNSKENVYSEDESKIHTDIVSQRQTEMETEPDQGINESER